MAASEHRRILVTGATGFIGSNLVRHLSAEGWRVRAAARSPGGAPLPSSAEWFTCDLTEPDSLAGIEAGIEAVVHCAGALGAWGVGEAELRRVNVDGTRHLLDRIQGKTRIQFVHLSAGGVTGPVASRIASEQYPCEPVTAYERTKLQAEREVLARASGQSMRAVVVRPTFTYGPGDGHKLALFRAIQRGRFALLGGGRSLLHPVYIDDLVAGIALALERGRSGQVYILGGPRPVSTRELADTIAASLGVARPWLSVPVWLARAVAPTAEALGRLLPFDPVLTRSRVLMMSSDYGYQIDKAVEELGYEPRIDLPGGITATVRDYRARGLL